MFTSVTSDGVRDATKSRIRNDTKILHNFQRFDEISAQIFNGTSYLVTDSISGNYEHIWFRNHAILGRFHSTFVPCYFGSRPRIIDRVLITQNGRRLAATKRRTRQR